MKAGGLSNHQASTPCSCVLGATCETTGAVWLAFRLTREPSSSAILLAASALAAAAGPTGKGADWPVAQKHKAAKPVQLRGAGDYSTWSWDYERDAHT